ncbi:unnamed protein product [Rotaria sp. Silwood2]|nr:unnamed protein product [Rotaria sp. Silwood2]CAF2819485.1 unnamed protein product [Rotaria sp. Silwood2]CAF3064585.1 unnamed protein product [Rotaria sp. Silwood2]CAF3210763.1 unnamed protein product [Rotaria sp. Silwood2]CAF4134473.1 unnamed protein product [Rotaria sp. Silwood2]
MIDELIENEIQQGFPDAALIITRYGKIIKQPVYGYKLKYDENATMIKQLQLLTLDTMFDLASLTKNVCNKLCAYASDWTRSIEG